MRPNDAIIHLIFEKSDTEKRAFAFAY